MNKLQYLVEKERLELLTSFIDAVIKCFWPFFKSLENIFGNWLDLRIIQVVILIFEEELIECLRL
jgi:hypothetical protein